MPQAKEDLKTVTEWWEEDRYSEATIVAFLMDIHRMSIYDGYETEKVHAAMKDEGGFATVRERDMGAGITALSKVQAMREANLKRLDKVPKDRTIVFKVKEVDLEDII